MRKKCKYEATVKVMVEFETNNPELTKEDLNEGLTEVLEREGATSVEIMESSLVNAEEDAE